MANTIIDVIIPFHTINHFLISSIKSAKASKGVKIRVIAVNDTGSSVSKNSIGLDNCDVLISSFGQGYLDALATGVSRIDSTFVGFQDSDDFSDPWRLFNQIKYLKENDFDLVTCQLIKTNLYGQKLTNRSILGNIPESLSTQQKLIFGPHGADSTIVVKSRVVNDTWHIHKKFSPSFADYGWLLSILPQIKIGHCHDAKYFYRSHKFQMSRTLKDPHDWSQLSKLWISNFITTLETGNSNLAAMVQTTDKHEKVSLAIAYPSTLPFLKGKDRLLLIDIISEMRKCFEFESITDKKTFNNLLSKRGLLATRGTHIMYWPQAPSIFCEAFISLASGIQPRVNR